MRRDRALDANRSFESSVREFVSMSHTPDSRCRKRVGRHELCVKRSRRTNGINSAALDGEIERCLSDIETHATADAT